MSPELSHAEYPNRLYVNDGILNPAMVGELKPTSLDTPLDDVRRRLRDDGYVFLKGLLPQADVLNAREQYFRLLAPSGILKAGTDPVDGIFNSANESLDYPAFGAGHFDGPNDGPNVEQSARYIELGVKAHTEPWYKESFARHPVLLDYVAKLTGWGRDTLELQRTMLRNCTPGNKAIGIHYDQIFLRHGEDTVLTAWVPIGDVSVNGGGLIYLEKKVTVDVGHTLGSEIERRFAHQARSTGMTEKEMENAFNQNMMAGGMLSQNPIEFGEQYERKWLVTAYEAGDVVFHDSYAIHASTTNNDPHGVIRLATDLRFVNSQRPWDTRWKKDFELGDGL
ncbi:phytanoyl-CoA hydroxylase [Amylocarpus encephaloides]|uniref:Phytanoyl-CoA hydroxylase n=1 Tax=Amylocarpus encephaloides TaxID=45428 RepID=A0A9P7YBN5_9HELO|nr:phytanoyl-CoA hydroxylase [Amylocarpus encephaloides]